MKTLRSLQGRKLFITGGGRGMGLAIAARAARDGANVVMAANEKAGGRALRLVLDADAIQVAITRAAQHFGGLDICVNNASAIHLARSEEIELKRFDLIQRIKARQGACPEIASPGDHGECGACHFPSRWPDVHGNFLLDDDVRREAGVIDFAAYRYDSGSELAIDIFVASDG